jgi:hypothetical protein
VQREVNGGPDRMRAATPNYLGLMSWREPRNDQTASVWLERFSIRWRPKKRGKRFSKRPGPCKKA